MNRSMLIVALMLAEAVILALWARETVRLWRSWRSYLAGRKGKP